MVADYFTKELDGKEGTSTGRRRDAGSSRDSKSKKHNKKKEHRKRSRYSSSSEEERAMKKKSRSQRGRSEDSCYSSRRSRSRERRCNKRRRDRFSSRRDSKASDKKYARKEPSSSEASPEAKYKPSKNENTSIKEEDLKMKSESENETSEENEEEQSTYRKSSSEEGIADQGVELKEDVKNEERRNSPDPKGDRSSRRYRSSSKSRKRSRSRERKRSLSIKRSRSRERKQRQSKERIRSLSKARERSRSKQKQRSRSRNNQSRKRQKSQSRNRGSKKRSRSRKNLKDHDRTRRKSESGERPGVCNANITQSKSKGRQQSRSVNNARSRSKETTPHSESIPRRSQISQKEDVNRKTSPCKEQTKSPSVHRNLSKERLKIENVERIKKSLSRENLKSASPDGRRSKSKERNRSSRNRQQRDSRDRKQSKDDSMQHSQSKKLTNRKRIRSKERHGSRGIKRKRSRERDSSRSRDRKRSRDKERRLSQSSLRKERNRSRSSDRSTNRSRERRLGSLSRYRRSTSRDRRRHSRERGGEKIDKAALLEAAKKNTLSMIEQGTLPQSLIVDTVLLKQKLQLETAAFKEKSKSVDELTKFCRILSKNEVRATEGQEDSSSEDSSLNIHPFKLPEPNSHITMKNAVQLPIQSLQEKATRTQFPVSSGTQHRQKELERIPVEKNKSTASSSDLPPLLALLTPPSPPSDSFVEPPIKVKIAEVAEAMKQRVQATQSLQEDPNNVEATDQLLKANTKIKSWTQPKVFPGQFTGSTDIQLLTPEQLGSPIPAWVKKDQFARADPVGDGVGMSMLRKMGWNPGEGLGKNKEGTLLPLLLDIKTDKKGLASGHDPKPRKTSAAHADASGRHPVSVLMELCSKHNWEPPSFSLVAESGPSHKRSFLFQVKVQGVDYRPSITSINKKVAKAQAATFCLRTLGYLPI